VFFALRLSYRFSDLIVRMGSFLQLIPDFHFESARMKEHLEPFSKGIMRQDFIYSNKLTGS
jgi:hypothetical protein